MDCCASLAMTHEPERLRLAGEKAPRMDQLRLAALVSRFGGTIGASLRLRRGSHAPVFMDK